MESEVGVSIFEIKINIFPIEDLVLKFNGHFVMLWSSSLGFKWEIKLMLGVTVVFAQDSAAQQKMLLQLPSKTGRDRVDDLQE